MTQNTNIYSINIMGPLSKESARYIIYNELPIVCITKKTMDELLNTNTALQQSILTTIRNIGEELVGEITLNVRIINSNREVSDNRIPVKKYFDIWK